jgi:AmmeMemoRadiSam system protein B/AmmeMemoRadiSam system protein A
MFYPGDARTLAADVEELLGGAENLQPRLGFPKALIVPHAGYVYSGSVAAQAYDAIASARGIVRRVVLLGPVHRVAVRGLAVPTAEAFATPLGTIPIDREALQAVADLPQVVTSDPAHEREHSLEVQLPFLQKALGAFKLAPFAVGRMDTEQVAQVIERLWGGPETLIVISTDLSHYHAYDAARRMDGTTISRVIGMANDINHQEACGATPLNGFLALAKRKGLKIKLLAACNSGDTAGPKDRVVGYSSFGLYEGGEVSLDEAGPALLRIARESIGARLLDKPRTLPDLAWLRQTSATFVTLTKGGKLRGCIGSLAAVRPLGLDVAENAVAAATRDPRFPVLTAEEAREVRVEVSLLSAPKPMRFADEADLMRQIVPGEDGLILECDGRRGTFLPQVWEGIPDRQEFMRALVRKAGLPADTRLGRCKMQRYRVVKWQEPLREPRPQ